ncbi:MAG: HEAT repeat domain-containing protein [Pseudomonadota bacterium]
MTPPPPDFKRMAVRFILIFLGGVLSNQGCAGRHHEIMLKIQDTSPDVRMAAADKLGRIKDVESFKLLLPLLRDEDEDVVQSSIVALGAIGHKGAIGPLIALLNHPDAGVRYALKKTLIGFGPDAIQPLINALRQDDPDIQQAAAELLGRVGDARGILALAVLLSGPFPDKVRMAAAAALGDIGDSRSVVWLVNALKEKNSPVPHLVPDALAKIGSPAIMPLILLLDEKEEDIVRLAVISLGKIGQEEGVKPLIGKLAGSEPLTRRLTIEALVKTGRPSVIPLIEEIKFGGEAIQEECMKALASIGAPSVLPLIGELKGTDTRFRIIASDILSDIGAASVTPLIEAMRDESSEIQDAAGEILAKIGSPAVLSLIAGLKEVESPMAVRCASALGNIRDERAVEPLLEAMKLDHLVLRNESADALIKIGGPPVASLIREAFETESSSGDLALEVLIRIGCPAVNLLIKAVKEKSGDTRRKASTVLTQIGFPAIFPVMDLLSDNDLVIQEEAVRILTEIGPPSVLPLMELLEKKDPKKAWRAVGILGAIGDRRAVPGLVAATKGSDPVVRYLGVEALEKIGDADSIGALVDSLADWPVRRRSAQALDRFNWRPSDSIQTIRYQIAQGKNIMPHPDEALVKRVLLSDLRQTDFRKVCYAVHAMLGIWGNSVLAELKDLLEMEGTTEMAQAFIGSGSEILTEAGMDWAAHHPSIPPLVKGEIILYEANP